MYNLDECQFLKGISTRILLLETCLVIFKEAKAPHSIRRRPLEAVLIRRSQNAARKKNCLLHFYSHEHRK